MANDIFAQDELDVSYGRTSDAGSRYFGGSHLKDHPFIKGYFQVFFALPSAIFQDANPNNYTGILTSTCKSFTPPGDRTINTVDIMGQGGVGASYASGQTIARDFSLTFDETWGAPVWRILRRWTSAIFNPYTGVSDVMTQFVGAEYKGRCMVVETKPVRLDSSADDKKIASNIIRVTYFDGVMPTSDINSVFDQNVTDNTQVTLNVPFKFDGYPLDHTNKKTFDLAVKMIKNAKLYESAMDYYKNIYMQQEESGSLTSSKTPQGISDPYSS